MTKQRRVIERGTLSTYELGWLVGILEGEGSFRYQNSHAVSGCQLVDIGMSDEDTIYKVASLFERLGCGCDVKYVEPKIASRKDMYRIQITGERARFVMKVVVKHMSYRRRQQIWMALNKCPSKRLRSREQGNVINLAELGFGKKEIA